MARHLFKIRRATRRDIPGILALMQEWRVENKETPPKRISPSVAKSSFGRGHRDHFLVATDEDGIISFAFLRKLYDLDGEDPYFIMEALYVTKSKRSLGVGNKMMAGVARLAKQEMASTVVWYVAKSSRRGKIFYARQGAKPDAYVIRYLRGKALMAKARAFPKI